MTEQEKTAQDSTQQQTPPKDQTKQLIIFAVILCFAALWGFQNPRPALRVIAVLLGFGGIVMIHEFGHFIVAKLGGIKVEAFSIGMGPVVLGIRKLKKGWRVRVLPKIGESQQVEEGDNETEYQIAMLPIGGFVKMLGQSDTGAADESDDPRSYNNRPVWIRMCVVSAGVIFNAISAVILFMALYMNGIDLPAAIVGEVTRNSPAYDAGIKPGDEIIEVNGSYYLVDGHRCVDFETVFQSALLSSGEPVSYVVRHADNTEETIELIPERPVGDERGLRFTGIDRAQTLEINPDIAKDPNLVEELYDKTKFRPGDVVKSVDGKAVMNPWQYQSLLSQTFKSEVELRVSRQWSDDSSDGKPTMVSVKFPMWISPTYENFRDEYDLAHFCLLVPRIKVGSVPPEPKVVSLPRRIINVFKTKILRQKIEDNANDNPLPLKEGDVLLKIADIDYPNYKQLRELTIEYKDKDMPITVLRQDEKGVDQKVEMVLKPKTYPGSKRVMVGFSPALDLEYPVVAQTIAVAGQVALRPEIPPGATIVALDGEPVSSFFEIASLLQKNAGHKISVDYVFDGQTGGTAIVVPEYEPIHAQAYIMFKTPFSPFAEWTREFKASNPVDAVEMGCKKVWQFIVGNYATLGQLFKKDGVPVSALSGPVGIIRMTYQVTEASFDRYLYFLGLISACLAVMNLMPLPVLDGGHIILLIIEKITGRPVHEKILAPVMYVGLVLILGLILWITYNDLIRILFG